MLTNILLKIAKNRTTEKNMLINIGKKMQLGPHITKKVWKTILKANGKTEEESDKLREKYIRDIRDSLATDANIKLRRKGLLDRIIVEHGKWKNRMRVIKIER